MFISMMVNNVTDCDCISCGREFVNSATIAAISEAVGTLVCIPHRETTSVQVLRSKGEILFSH
jgi:hypothetical protein